MKRILIFSIVLFLFSPVFLTRAQKADLDLSNHSEIDLSIQNVLEQFQESSPQVKILEGNLAKAKAEARAAKLWKNPEVGYRVEDAGTKDTFIEGSWTVDVSGRKWLERKAANAGIHYAENLYKWEINSLFSDVKSRFYELLAGQERLRIAEEGARRYQAILKDVRSRGNQADYDRLRLEKEAGEMKADAHEINRELFILQNDFSLLLGQSIEQKSLEGDFKVVSKTVADESILLSNHPRIVAALKASEKSQYLRKAARRKWFPELNLSGGYKSSSEEGEKDQGYVAGISVAIPLFDRGQSDSDTAKAESKIADAQGVIGQKEILNTFQLKQKDRAVLETALREYETAMHHAEKLEQMAGIAYLEGRMTVLELLDAYRGGVESRIRLLNLNLETKLAEIEFERIIGRSLDQ